MSKLKSEKGQKWRIYKFNKHIYWHRKKTQWSEGRPIGTLHNSHRQLNGEPWCRVYSVLATRDLSICPNATRTPILSWLPPKTDKISYTRQNYYYLYTLYSILWTHANQYATFDNFHDLVISIKRFYYLISPIICDLVNIWKNKI